METAQKNKNFVFHFFSINQTQAYTSILVMESDLSLLSVNWVWVSVLHYEDEAKRSSPFVLLTKRKILAVLGLKETEKRWTGLTGGQIGNSEDAATATK